MTLPLDPETRIRREAPALRRLAEGLLSDDLRAQEAMQELRIARWRNHATPPSTAYARGWLRNVAARLRRDGARRRRHELEAGSTRPQHAPPTDQRLARHETVQMLAEAVSALSEPFREAVVQRFYQQLPPREIAARLGVPVATVRSRIRRGLEELRRMLDRRDGDPEAWRLGLIACFGLEGGRGAAAATLPLFTGWLMSKSALALVALVLGTLWFLLQDPAAESKALPVPTSMDSAQAEPTARTAGPDAQSPADPPELRRQGSPQTAASWTLRTVTPEGQAVPGATIYAGQESNRLMRIGTTDPAGTLRLPAADTGDDAPRLVLATANGRLPSRVARLDRGPGERTLVLRAGASGRVTGRIFDPDGRGLEGASVYAGRNEPATDAQRERGLATKTAGLFAVTDTTGEFVLDGVLAGWFRFIVSHPDYAPAVVFREMEANGEHRIVYELRRGTAVSGRVIDRDGRAVAGAVVRQGPRGGFETRGTRTAADGSYRTAPLMRGQSLAVFDSEGVRRNVVEVPREVGELWTWNPVLGEGQDRLRGRIVGHPDPGRLRLRAGPLRSLRQREPVDPFGAFAVTPDKNGAVTIAVFEPNEDLPLAVRRFGASDATPDLVLELSEGQGYGSVVAMAPAGNEGAALRLVRTQDGARIASIEPELATDGSLLWHGIPGGADYRVVTELGALGGEFALARLTMPRAGANLDLGALELPGLGTVRFGIELHPSAAGSTPEILLERIDDNHARVFEKVAELPAESVQLPPGRYRLDVELSPGPRRSTTFEVRADDELVIPLRLDARRDHRIQLRGLAVGNRATVTLSALDRGPNAPAERSWRLLATRDEPRPSTVRFPLAPGPYRIQILCSDGRQLIRDVLQPGGDWGADSAGDAEVLGRPPLVLRLPSGH